MAAVAKKRKADTKPVCKYGSKCYRRNPQHLQNYRHPGRDNSNEKDEDDTQEYIKGAESKQEKKTTISDYFGTEKKSHNMSDSDSDEESSNQPPNKKRTFEKEHIPSPDDDNERKEEDDTDINSLPPSPEDVRENVKAKFLVEMPEDFYQFWNFCKSLNPSCPCSALEKTLNLLLVGPYDILAGRHQNVKKNKQGHCPNFLLHYRFYYDPPEFQTVIVAKNDSKFHLGYFRDDPKEAPVFVASNSPVEALKEKIYQCGENIFAAVYIYACKQVKSCVGDKRKGIEHLIKSLEEEAQKHDLSLAATTKRMKERQKKVVCPTFHGAGMVVPVDANEVGYRPVPETPGDLRAMLKKISESKSDSERDQHFEALQELITLVQFANDECDYGEGLELGLDLFSFGAKVFHPQVASLLPLGYQLLNRPEFAKIIEQHLKRRKQVTECVDELVVG